MTLQLTPDTAEARKARGAFLTPPELCRYVADWAIRSASDEVLEPSCGQAAFLLAAGERLDTLAAVAGDIRSGERGIELHQVELHGVELHRDSARQAEAFVRSAGYKARVLAGDFFLVPPNGRYDAVIGNPPYVRYQDFAGEARSRSREAALRAGVSLTRLASSWAAFTVHSALFLKPGGRLGLVLPAELLSVNYAAEVRRFLMQRFRRVRLMLFTERVFPGVQEEVVLLLADGYGHGPADHCELQQVRSAVELSGAAPLIRTWKPDPVEGKWTRSLLSTAALETHLTIERSGYFTTLQSWGETTLGMVTGNNKYFALPADRASELGLRSDELLPLSPPGSRHLRGLTFTVAAHQQLTSTGSSTSLFRPPRQPSRAARRYIQIGERLGVHTAYKCRVRTPWWRVPLVAPCDVLLTYMNADSPRLCANHAGTHHLNSVHGVYLRPELRELGIDLLPLGALTSMTLLSAETVGRAYGGGMLKLEPKEADRLAVPEPDVLRNARTALAAIRPQVAARLSRPGGLAEAVALVDDILLVGELGIAASEVKSLRDAHVELAARRAARGGASRALARAR
ncbi:MAG: N-6 DNA methylase [Pseudonocardiales bacterium]|nr:N-6 DNA methylase [Pseudonocardiales bacterium]